MKRICAILLAALVLSGCQMTPVDTPALPQASFPAATASPPEFTFVPSKTDIPPAPTPENGFFGEWAGYVSMSEEGFIYSMQPTYTVKLTLTENGGWLSMDKLPEGRFYFADCVQNSTGNCGVKLAVQGMDKSTLTLRVEEYAYAQEKQPPLAIGDAMELMLYSIGADMNDVEMEMADFAPTYLPLRDNDMLYGKIGEWTVSLARFGTLSGVFPRWYPKFEGFQEGVRGVYGFGEHGADNSNTSNIVVYHDSAGLEHIRFCFGEFDAYINESGEGLLRSYWPMMDLGLSLSSTPYWHTLYTLDTATGEFRDVSGEQRAYYKEVMLKNAARTLIEALYQQDIANEQDAAFLECLTEYYRLAYEAAYGMRPDALPTLPKPEVNSKQLRADVDGDGVDETVEAMFYSYYDPDTTLYDSVWFCIDGQWSYPIRLGLPITPDFCTVDIDKNEPGVEIAVEIPAEDGPSVTLYKWFPEGGMAYVCNDRLYGQVLDATGPLHIEFPGDKSVIGIKRSIFSPDIFIRQHYTSLGGFLNRDEAPLYEAYGERPITLTQSLYAYMVQDTASQAVEVFAGQQITALASDEKEWLKVKTASGHILWVHGGFFTA